MADTTRKVRAVTGLDTTALRALLVAADLRAGSVLRVDHVSGVTPSALVRNCTRNAPATCTSASLQETRSVVSPALVTVGAGTLPGVYACR